MQKSVVVIDWELLDEYIREQVEMEMESLGDTSDLEPDFKLFTYNYTSVKDIDKDLVVTAIDAFVGMDSICEVRDIATEFINYNYGYGGSLEDQEEFFMTHYVCISMLSLVDNELHKVTSHMEGEKHIITGVSASSTGVIFNICTMKED
ncbi:hypothetical protein TSMG0154 [Halocynthia phage JM-2012]|uniref:hypothetical protein n=1 Tax=Halocynthia phage JM-2012 TaxID=1173297 RepID=UPI00025C6976|nr:hypothetical protein TSMG0154 [Halocynthia phage JM-2012]AFI55437.1 hypothetical protein TSMG0154 [Halocynthia phage JM-2012]